MSSNPLILPEMPAVFRPMLGVIKTAADHEKIDPIVTYWARLYALQECLKIEKKSPECLAFLTALMSWLEKEKEIRKNDESYLNEVVAQAHIDNYAVKLFTRADSEDRAGKAGRNTIKIYFTASQVFDILNLFGETTEEVGQKSKYAKWRAAYISRCLKNNEVPLPPESEESSGQSTANDTFNTDQNNTSEDYPTATNPTPPYPTLPFNEGSTFQPQNPSILPQITPRITKSQPTSPSKSDNSNQSVSNSSALNGKPLNPEIILKAQKFCKYAGSALQYEDIGTAVDNLEKALSILKTGQQ